MSSTTLLLLIFPFEKTYYPKILFEVLIFLNYFELFKQRRVEK